MVDDTETRLDVLSRTTIDSRGAPHMSINQLLTELGVPQSASDDGVLQTTIMVNNTAQLRQLFDIGLSPERRAEHADALLDGIAAPSEYPQVGLLHRLT